MRHWQATLRHEIGGLAPVLAVVLSTTLWSGSRSELQLRHPDLETRVTGFLRWANFWQHEHHFKNYSPGKPVTLKAFYSSQQVFVCLLEVEVWMSFAVNARGQLIALNNGLFYDSTPEMLVRRLLNPRPWPSVKSASSARVEIQDNRPSETDVLTAYRVETWSFRLPELTLPNSVLSKATPEELKSLEAVVRVAMTRWLCGGPSIPEAIIPRFELDDPWVYIAVDGKGLQRGYFLFQWRDGKWTSEKEWWPYREGDSEIIRLAKSYPLTTVKAKCPD